MSTRKRSGKKKIKKLKLVDKLWNLVTYPKMFFKFLLSLVTQNSILTPILHLSKPYEEWVKTLSRQTGQSHLVEKGSSNSQPGRKRGSFGTTKKRTTLDALHENLSKKTKLLILGNNIQDAAEKARELMLQNDQWRFLRHKNNLRSYNSRYNIICTTKNYNKSLHAQEVIREANKRGFTVL